MINYLKGKVLEIDETALTLLLGEESVIGYSVKIPQSEAYHVLQPGNQIEFYVYTHVKEDQIQPYGFLTKLEKELFLHLLQVSGIGPKAALSVLSHVRPEVLIEALLNQEPKMIGKIPGVGKKTLERMFIDLVGPIQKKVESGQFLIHQSTKSDQKNAPTGASSKDPQILDEAKTALSALGFKEVEFMPALTTVLRSDGSIKVEDLVKQTLKRLR